MLKRVTIGSLRERIIFQSRETIINKNGFAEEKWLEILKVWGSVVPLSFREKNKNDTKVSEKEVKVIIRYRNYIDETMRIKFRESYYEIESIEDIDFAKKFLEIKAKEVTRNT